MARSCASIGCSSSSDPPGLPARCHGFRIPWIDLEGLLEGVGDLLGVLAAGLGEVGPAAAAAADDRGDLLEPVAGVQAAGDQVGGQAGGELDLAVGGRGQEDRQPVGRLAAEDVDQLRAARRAMASSTAWTTTVALADGRGRGEQVVGRDLRRRPRPCAGRPAS